MDELLYNLNYNLKKISFFKKFSFDIWVTIIIIIIFTVLSIYFNVLANLKSLRKDWVNDDREIKCNPSYMIFANIISGGKDTPIDTLKHCANIDSLQPISRASFDPFSKHFNILNLIFTILYSIVLSIKGIFIMIFNILLSIVELIQKTINKIFMEMYYILIVFNDTIQKILVSGNIIYYILVEIINLIKIILIKFSRSIMTCLLGPLLNLNNWVQLQKLIIFFFFLWSFAFPPLGFLLGSILLVIFSKMCEPAQQLNDLTGVIWKKFLEFNMAIDRFGAGLSTVPPDINTPLIFAGRVNNIDKLDSDTSIPPDLSCNEYEKLLEPE